MATVEERLKELAEASVVAAIWDPLLHPRARNGQFIKVGGFVRGLFNIGNGDKQTLNGRVMEVRQNSRDKTNPIVIVNTKHGDLTTTADQIEEATQPKGFFSKLSDMIDMSPDPVEEAYYNRSLEGDVVFDTGKSLEGRDLNGIALTEVDFDPHTVPDKELNEPELPPTAKKQSAGVMIEEPDGRIWLVEPRNHFGGYEATVTKGRVEEGDTVQQAALREAFEEMGLVVELTDYIGDYEGSVTNTRMYKGRRIAGSPWKHDDESAEVRLVSPDTATTMFNTERDQQILSDLTGDPKYIEDWLEAHPPPPPSKYDWLKRFESEYGRENVQLKGQQQMWSPYVGEPKKGRPLFDPGPTQLRKEKEKREALSLTEQFGTNAYKKQTDEERAATEARHLKEDAVKLWMHGQNLRAQIVTEEGLPLQVDMENHVEGDQFFGDITASRSDGTDIGYISYDGDEYGVFLDEWEVDPEHDEDDVFDAMTLWLESLGVPLIDQADIEDEATQTDLLQRIQSSAFNELLHPRGRDGKFIEVGGFVRGMFTLPNGARKRVQGKVTGVSPNEGNPDDPFIEIETPEGGDAVALASQVSAVAEPKAVLQVQDVNTKMFLKNGVMANIKRIEREPDGSMFVITTMDERIPSSQIADMNPKPTNPKKPEGFDPLLPWNNDLEKPADAPLPYPAHDPKVFPGGFAVPGEKPPESHLQFAREWFDAKTKGEQEAIVNQFLRYNAAFRWRAAIAWVNANER